MERRGGELVAKFNSVSGEAEVSPSGLSMELDWIVKASILANSDFFDFTVKHSFSTTVADKFCLFLA